MTAAGSGDAWRISGEDRAKHDAQFFSLKPINGYITGEQARGFFMQSGLSTPALGQIWSLADMNNDGKMDKKEFSIAMHLIKKRLQGYEIPKSLPHSLKADPSPVMGSFGTMGSQPAMMGMPAMSMQAPMGMAPRMPMMVNGMAPMAPAAGFTGAVPVSTGFTGQPRPQGPPAASGGNFAMPHGSKLKYTQLFNTNDHSKRGTLTGVEARSILFQTGVPQHMLAQIWNLSDVDKDGKLDCEEFCIAMHLIDVVKMGQMLPGKLPAELLPSKTRSGSFGAPPPTSTAVVPGPPKDNFGDLLGNMGMPAPVQPTPVTNGDAAKIDEQVTFEDRRKQNFDKGQAELERRRQMLQDQMKKEEEARLQKEREEYEKREKIRREQEMKKQQALERQLEKQREIERQKDEQRQKMLEQREAARRELERQRQMEWERQRKEQLMAEKIREYEQLTSLKARSSNLKCELESLQGKKTETNLKISQVKNGVNDLTAHIEAMRSTRDLKNKDIDRLQSEIQNLNQKLQQVQSDRNSLDLKAQTSIQSNPMSETHRTMMHSVELKKTSVQRLKRDLEGIEKDTATKLGDIDTLNNQNTEMQKALAKMQGDISESEKKKKDSAKESLDQAQKDKEKHEKLRKDLESQRLREETQKKEVEASKDADSKWFDFGGDVKTSTATNGDNWASVFDTQAVSQASSVPWDSAFSSQTETKKSSNFKLTGPKKKYNALYQFDARNPDELSLMPGDTVMVFDDQTGSEPEWIGGELNGKRGWFPEAYVERVIEESSQSLFPATDMSSGGLSSSEDSSFMAVQGKVPAVSPTPGQGTTAPEGLQAQALYPWKAKKDNHLTFNKGDIINVKEQQDMWWSGEFGGKTGWFPKSYVKMVSGPSLSTPTNVSENSSPLNTLEKAGSARQSPALDQIQSDNIYMAVYTYQSTEPGDLTFNQGDIITVTTTEGDWWTGTFGSATGIFPANYVKKHDVQPLTEKADTLPGADTFTQSQLTDPFPDPFPVSEAEPIANTTNVDITTDDHPGDTAGSQNVNLSLDMNDFALNEAQNVSTDSESSSLGVLSVNSSLAFVPGVCTDSQSSSAGDQNVKLSLDVNAFAPIVSTESALMNVTSMSNVNPPSGGIFDSAFDTGDTTANSNDPVAQSESSGQVVSDASLQINDPFPDLISHSGFGGNSQMENNDKNQNAAETVTKSNDPIPDVVSTSAFGEDPFSSKMGPFRTETEETIGPLSDPFGNAFGDSKIDPFKESVVGSDDLVEKVSDPNAVKISESFERDEVDGKSNSTVLSSSDKDVANIDSVFPPVMNQIEDTLPVAVPTSQPSVNIADTDSPFTSDPFGGDPFPSNTSTSDDPFGGDPFQNAGSTGFDPFPSNTSTSDDPFKDTGFGEMSGPFPPANGSNCTDSFSLEPSTDISNHPTDPFASNHFLDPFANNQGSDPFASDKDPFASSDPFTNAFPSSDSGQPLGFDTPSMSGQVSIDSIERDAALASSSDLETQFGSWGVSDSNTTSIQTTQSLTNFTDADFINDNKEGRPFAPLRRKRKSTSKSEDSKNPARPPPPPKTYLQNAPGSAQQSDQSIETTEKVPDSSDGIFDDDNDDDTKPSSGTGTLKKPEIATVIAAYSATGNEQLSLSPGQLIQVRKKSPSGWWEGELQARGQKRKIGWFPANYVKLLGSSARNTPDNTLASGASPSTAMFINTTPTIAASPAPESTTPQPTSQNFIEHVIAIYPYSAQNPDELTFQKDAVINVTKKDDPDWWQGECNGNVGMFPSNYVTSTTPESTSWSSDPQVIATTSTEEGKRQSYIHELINTEESYMKDMSIVLEAFYKPLAEGKALSEENLKNIFVNWKELIVCNTKLQKALRVRKKMCGEGQVINSIGDILCENIPHLTPYIRFCSCQLNAAALLQRISENNSLFNEVHKKCVQNPKTKGMPMSSFLLKPMQRITKYPLIVEKILKYTPEGHPDHNHLQEALEHCQELCSQVNEGVREKENSDRLEWIQQHVHCDGLPEKITFNSVTNCLGPRKILHTGVVYKIKSNKELGAFLFNDFLLFTTANRPLSNATHSLFDVTGQVQYKMYKTPVFLNEVMIKKHEDDDSFVVSHIDRVFHLRCSSKGDRDIWLRRLTNASNQYLDTIKKKREKAYSSPKHSRGVGRLLVIILEGINLICSKDVRRSPGVGRLLVVIIEGKDLQPSDANGKSDPYCEVSMGAQEHKTKVINNSLNPKWNASMQFTVKDLKMDALCISVFDRDLFSPNDFLGRTEIRILDILKEAGGVSGPRQPLVKHLVLHEVPTGEIVVKLDLHLYDQT